MAMVLGGGQAPYVETVDEEITIVEVDHSQEDLGQGRLA